MCVKPTVLPEFGNEKFEEKIYKIFVVTSFNLKNTLDLCWNVSIFASLFSRIMITLEVWRGACGEVDTKLQNHKI